MRPFGGWTGVWLTLHTRGGYVEQFPPITKAPGEPLPAPALSPGTPRLSAEALLTVAVRLLALLKVEPLAEAPTDLDVCVAVAGLGEGRTVEAEVEQEAEQSHGHSQQTHWRGQEVTAPLSQSILIIKISIQERCEDLPALIVIRRLSHLPKQTLLGFSAGGGSAGSPPSKELPLISAFCSITDSGLDAYVVLLTVETGLTQHLHKHSSHCTVAVLPMYGLLIRNMTCPCLVL